MKTVVSGAPLSKLAADIVRDSWTRRGQLVPFVTGTAH